jgi:hypothetical protein
VVNHVGQTEILPVQPLVSQPCFLFELEIAFEEVNRHKSPGIDQIPAELIQARSKTLCSHIHKLINSVWNKKELPEQWKESIILRMHKKGDKIVIIEDYHCYQPHTKFYPTFFCHF